MKPEHDKEEIFERYLLGQMSEEERSDLERRFFADDALFEELTAADLDLIDAYARNEMSPVDREAFEPNLLSSARRRRRVATAKALETIIDREGSEPAGILPIPRGERPLRESAWNTWRPGLQTAAAIFAVLAGAWALIVGLRLQTQGRAFQSQRATLERRIEELEKHAQVEQARVEQPAGGVEQDRDTSGLHSPEIPAKGSEKRRTVSFVLTAGLLRDLSESNRLIIPPDTDSVVLQLALEPSDYQSYDALLQGIGRAPTWRKRQLKPISGKTGTVIKLDLAGNLFAPGDYVLRLRGTKDGGLVDPVAEYSFRVVRE